MAKPKERELSALELMIAHADGVNSSVAGMPKGKRRQKASNDEPNFDFDFNDYDPLMEDEEVTYVGPGSRAKNKEAKERRAQREKERVRYAQTPQPVAQPNSREVETALEDLFIAGEKSGDDIVKAIRDGNAVSEKTQKALENWLDWEKSEAFKEKNKAKSDPHGNQPGAGNSVSDAVPDDSGGDDGGSLFDGDGPPERRRKRGKRYGRNRGERRGPGRNLPSRRTLGSRFSRLRKMGKYGKFAALALTVGAAFGVGSLMKNSADDEAEGSNANNQGVGTPGADADANPNGASTGAPVPTQVDQQQVQRADDAAKQTIDNDSPRVPSIVQDSAVDGATVLLAGASKRLPIVGSVLGNGLQLANNIDHINSDKSLSDADKTKAKEVATGSAVGGAAGGSVGAVAGGWIGGILGSVVPVAGTAAGAALGATIGGILGDYFGSSVGEYVSTKITDESDKMLADGEKDRKEKMDDYNDTTMENLDKAKTPPPTIMPFNFAGLGGMPGSGAGTYQGPFRAQPARRMDSKQVTDIANKAIAEGGLGAVSEQFESGGRGVGTVSTGQGDAGGVSYGKHQLATNNGSMMNFLNSPEGKPFLQRFGGLAPGTSEFNSVYKDVANTQGADFDKAQSDYITRTHYAPLVAKMQNEVGVDLSNRGAGVKELLYSTAVQYGAGTSVVSNALRGKDVNAMSDDDLIKTIQDYKASTTDRYFKSSSAQTQQSVATRAQNEKDVLLKVAEADRKKNSVNSEQLAKDGHKPSEVRSSADKAQAPQAVAANQELAKPQEITTNDVNRIQPVAQPEAPVERQPLVSEGDIARQEPPPAPAPAQTDATPTTTASASPRPVVPQQQNARPGNAHSLDAIPVFLDDPMMNMMTMGYM